MLAAPAAVGADPDSVSVPELAQTPLPQQTAVAVEHQHAGLDRALKDIHVVVRVAGNSRNYPKLGSGGAAPPIRYGFIRPLSRSNSRRHVRPPLLCLCCSWRPDDTARVCTTICLLGLSQIGQEKGDRNVVAIAEQPRTAARQQTQLALIDADVHPSIADYTQLHPYLPETWRRHVSARGFGGPSSGIVRGQGGLYRSDTTPPDGGEPGSDPAFLRAQLMDRYNVHYPILNGGNILGLGTLPDPDFATAIAGAYND